MRLANDGAPGVQVAIGAALLMPVFALYYLQTLPAAFPDAFDAFGGAGRLAWSLGLHLVVLAYFLVVVAARARDGARRIRALFVGGVGALVSTVGWLISPGSSGAGGLVTSVIGASMVLDTMLYVAAWGLARRRSRWWALGLAPSFVIAVVTRVWAQATIDHSWTWVHVVLSWVGPFIVGCLLCWLIDVVVLRGTDAPTGNG